MVADLFSATLSVGIHASSFLDVFDDMLSDFVELQVQAANKVFIRLHIKSISNSKQRLTYPFFSRSVIAVGFSCFTRYLADLALSCTDQLYSPYADSYWNWELSIEPPLFLAKLRHIGYEISRPIRFADVDFFISVQHIVVKKTEKGETFNF